MILTNLALLVHITSAFQTARHFSPAMKSGLSTALFNGPEIGAGGMADTRNPDALQHEDARKSISAAPSFEEYLKMRDGAAAPAPAPAAPARTAPAPAASTPSTPAAPAAAAASSGPEIGAGGMAEAISNLASSQETSIQKIQSTIPDLEVKPDFTWKGNDVIVESCPATLDARDAAGPANVAWLSSLCVETKMSSLQIFNGPLNDVPHLVSRCVVIAPDKLRLTIDFRPRAYGAYEMRKPDGSYPGPEELGRKSFEYSGARSDYDKKFGTEEVKQFLSSIPLDGATPVVDTPSELDLLTRGPLYTSLDFPLTDGNIASVIKAREQVVDYWLKWSQESEHEHRPGAPVNSQYVYDTKYKQNAFGALMNEYTTLFGADGGKQLAIGDSGPLDEAYVGGAS